MDRAISMRNMFNVNVLRAIFPYRAVWARKQEIMQNHYLTEGAEHDELSQC